MARKAFMRATSLTGVIVAALLSQAQHAATLSMLPVDVAGRTAAPSPPSPPPGRHVLPLHRQRVPVRSDADTVSYKSVYFGHISVGAPVAQAFTVVFDTGSGHIVLPSTYCQSDTCRVHNRYDPRLSANAVDVDYDGTQVKPGNSRDQVTVAYGTGEIVGQFVNDRLCLGKEDNASVADDSSEAVFPEFREVGATPPHCIEVRIVMATEMSHEPFHAFAFDGVLGLGLESLALDPGFSFFGVMTAQKHLDQPSFGVFLAEGDDEISEISFGGHSPEHVKTALSWAPVAHPDLGHWQVSIRSIRIGSQTLDYCDDGQCRAVVDTGTSLLAVPTKFADDWQRMLEESVVDPPANNGGSLDCRKAKGLEIHFEIDNYTVTLRPGDYSRPSMQLRDENDDSWRALEVSSNAAASAGEEGRESAEKPVGSCMPAIMPINLPEPLGPKLFIWGEPVLRRYYTAYDWQEKSIGFGLARHSSDDEEGAVPQKSSEERPAPETAAAPPKPRRKPLLSM